MVIDAVVILFRCNGTNYAAVDGEILGGKNCGSGIITVIVGIGFDGFGFDNAAIDVKVADMDAVFRGRDAERTTLAALGLDAQIVDEIIVS